MSADVHRRSVAIIGTRGYPSFYGGFETAVRVLAPYLAEREWDVTVYGRSGAEAAPAGFKADARVATRVTRGIETKSFSTLSYGLTSTFDAARRRPDVALVMNVANGFWLPLLKARGVPTVVNVDGIEWDREKWGRVAKAVFRRGAGLTARFADRLVFDAQAIGDYWQTSFGREGVFIPYGGDIPPRLPAPRDSLSGKYVLLVARFVPENTVPEFFDAVEAISQRHDVIIVGSSGYGGELERRARELAEFHPRVSWLGHVRDDKLLLALWQHCGAYFHGHSVGGTNPALVQAMACGAPVIARDTVYNREVLGDQGAMFVRPEPSQIVEAIDALMGDQEARVRMSQIALQRAQTTYSWDRVCEAYEAALEEARRK